MPTTQSVYTKRLQDFEQDLKQLKKKLFASSMLRLLIFLLTVFGVYIAFGNTPYVMGVLVLGIGLFLSLISRHANLQYKKEKLQQLIAINQTELQVLNRNFSSLPDGEEFKNPQHAFSQDIDLFGKRSFFQYLNRTALSSGKQQLADYLTGNAIKNIPHKQDAVKNLAKLIDFRQNFTAVAGMVKTKIRNSVIIDWLRNYQAFVPKIFKWLPTVFTIASALLIVAFSFNFISGWFLGGWLLLGWLIVSRYLKKVGQLSSYVSEVQNTFQQYYLLLELLENTSFEAEILQEKKASIQTETKKASVLLKEFSKRIDALERRNVLIFGQLMTGLMLWDLKQAYHLEQWLIQHQQRVENWFETIDFFDAYNSLGNFAYNHPNYVFPEIEQSNTVLKATEAAHPLLNSQEAVTNDFKIDQHEFFIVTGANMAGKSTFLRTVSLQIVMANVGLPVYAKTCSYSPIQLITSMRTVDSLADEASYFYAELSRLKFIVERLKNETYFIILDEILKGTNSTDKAIGSRKFIEKLVGSQSTGIIATHDLSLCEVAEELPQVKNYYFDAEIIQDELHFDYTLKKGICKNMNASFLLKKMEIVD
ncbi:MutS-related protein [Haloflavibacter putidus]|uniref:DNA mismatch repair protein MutS n=1 Tax=Haloflavibacter putidus TaxID=2576776 RepID=A0A507ZMC5_9FLAO|nr:DNA mismatch repair protein MutS [Haloflavibacter putidus]TQD38856.1 DNA mismatch repair protein MutS [Haloflavibacter putidus]